MSKMFASKHIDESSSENSEYFLQIGLPTCEFSIFLMMKNNFKAIQGHSDYTFDTYFDLYTDIKAIESLLYDDNKDNKEIKDTNEHYSSPIYCVSINEFKGKQTNSALLVLFLIIVHLALCKDLYYLRTQNTISNRILTKCILTKFKFEIIVKQLLIKYFNGKLGFVCRVRLKALKW